MGFSEISEGKVTEVQLKVTPYERNPYARPYVVINFDRRTVGTPSRSLLSNEQIKQLRDLGYKINRVMKFP